MGVIPIWSGVENRWLDSWNRYTAAYNIAAVAAQTGAARLRNPTGSGVIAVVEMIRYTPIVTVDSASVQLGASTVDLTVGTGNALDGRNPASSAMIVSQSSNGAAIGNLIGFMSSSTGRVMDDFIRTDNQEIPLLPGNALQVINTSVNVQILVTIMWRERALEDSEKQ